MTLARVAFVVLVFVGPPGKPAAAVERPLDPKWQWAPPHTLLVAPGGAVLYRREGAFDALALRRVIDSWLGRHDQKTPGGR